MVRRTLEDLEALGWQGTAQRWACRSHRIESRPACMRMHTHAFMHTHTTEGIHAETYTHKHTCARIVRRSYTCMHAREINVSQRTTHVRTEPRSFPMTDSLSCHNVNGCSAPNSPLRLYTSAGLRRYHGKSSKRSNAVCESAFFPGRENKVRDKIELSNANNQRTHSESHLECREVSHGPVAAPPALTQAACGHSWVTYH